MHMETPPTPDAKETRVAKAKEQLAARHRELADAYEGMSHMTKQDMIDAEHEIKTLEKELEALERGE